MIDYDGEIDKMDIKKTEESISIYKVLRGLNIINKLPTQWDVCNEMYRRVAQYYYNKRMGYWDSGINYTCDASYYGRYWLINGDGYQTYMQNLLRYLLDNFPVIHVDDYTNDFPKFNDYYSDKYSPHPIWMGIVPGYIDQIILNNRENIYYPYIILKKLLDIYILPVLRKIIFEYIRDELMVGLTEDNKNMILLNFSYFK